MLHGRKARNWRGRTAVATAVALTGWMQMTLASVSSAAVTAVKGSALAYTSSISLFGGQPLTATGPSVILAPTGGNLTQTDPDGFLVRVGPANFFSAASATVNTQGTLGASGSVTSTATLNGINASGDEVFTATQATSTCTATETGATGSTTITNGVLRIGEDGNGNPVNMNIPPNPAPDTVVQGFIPEVGDTFMYIFNEQILNPDGSLTVYAGHLRALGPTAVGDLFWGKSECGVTAGSLLTSTITTTATATATIGQPISDSATVTGTGPTPTGTVTFTAYGPNDATCSGSPAFTSAPQNLSSGSASSGPFTPTAPGTYRWIATYSGDPNHAPATSACNDANETSVVTKATPTVATSATVSATVGQPISDTATVTGVGGAPVPTGTVTFTAYGPNDATCSGSPAFTSSAQNLSSGSASSGPFTPASAGTYRWIASYSGDANYAAVTTACNEANETSTVRFPGPHMTLIKTAPAFAPAPATVTYTYTLVNDGTDTLFHVGVTDNHCAPVVRQSGDVNGDQLLNAGETWTYTCTQTITTPGTHTNTAQASGTNTQTGLPVLSNQAQATVTVTSGTAGGHVTLSKQASNPSTGQAPLSVTYTYTVVNDGSHPLSGVKLSDDLCPTPTYSVGDFNNDGVIGPGEVWTYTCTMTHTAIGTYTNHATVTATDTQTGQPVTSNTATSTVTVTGPAATTTTGPHMTLSKSANPTSGAAPLNVTYTYTLVNDGNDTLFHVGVTDNACAPVTLIGGDVNNNQLLNPGETWTFTCTKSLSATTTNSATANATNTQTGLAVSSNTAQATVTVSGGGGGPVTPPPTGGPHITLSKAANPTSGSAPLAVTYTYTLLNDGTDTLFHVGVTDNACAPVTYQSGDANNDQLVNAGETWTFRCTTTLPAGTHTNTATASGTNTQTGLAVTSNTAQATVTAT